MSYPDSYRVRVVGRPDDLARVRASVAGISAQFEVGLLEPGADDAGRPDAQGAGSAPDVLVLGPTLQSPLPLARDLRTAHPDAQIVFLLPPERLERFRLSLPFVPNMGSAWTASATADVADLGAVIGNAARVARERVAASTVLGRINAKLALGGRTAAEQVSLSHRSLSERYLTTVLTQSPDAFIALEGDGSVIAYNDAASRLFGPALRQSASAASLFPEDERPGIAAAIDRAWRGEAQANLEVGVAAASGGRRHLEISLAPISDGIGAVASVSLVARDVTERRHTQDRLREAERRLNAVLDNASVSIFLMDERQRCIYMNAAAEQLTGYSFAEAQGRVLHDVIHHTRPDGTPYPLAECPIDRAFPENNNVRGEDVFVHKDGHFYPVAFTASPVRDEASHTVGTIIEVQDITERKRAEMHQRLLINELNHRVKNTLALVQGLAQQSFRGDAPKAQARKAFEARLAALSAAHTLLTRQNWESALLGDIVAASVAATAGAGAERVRAEGPEILLAPKTAVSVGMAVHELCTNAVKHGALSTPAGHVLLRWDVRAGAEGERLWLEWSEHGGPPVEPPAQRGFGARMIERGLAAELAGEVRLAFRREGVVCTIDAPLPKTTEQ